MNKNYKAKVLENLENEYSVYLQNELKLPAKDLFDHSRQNNFYMVIYDMLTDEQTNLSDKDYKVLNEQGKCVIEKLYDSYSNNESAQKEVYNSFYGIVTDYIERNLNAGNYM